MNTLRKCISTAIAAASITSPVAFAGGIELGQGISVTGFIDMSFVYDDVDATGTPTTRVFAVDQVETDFLYTGSDGVSAQVDIEYGESGDGSGTDETFVEQAFITKAVNDSLTVKAGRFLSYSGWETEEPTGLFQYSGTGYAPYFYGYYQQGVSAYYDAGAFDFMVSVVNDAFANPIESDTTQLGTEFGVAYSMSESVTAKLFYITEGDKKAINFWTAYSADALTLAFEYNTAEDTLAPGSDGDGYLLMANYAAGDYGFTVRYHAFEIEDSTGTTVIDSSAISLAPSMAIGENLLLVAEYRMNSDDIGVDSDTFALEALFTF